MVVAFRRRHPEIARLAVGLMRVAIADPPYIGQSAKWYKNHPDYAGEVDHQELIERLSQDYDAWALCLSSSTLQEILGLCPKDVRTLAWVKSFTPFRKGVRLAYSWEPVIIRGWRKKVSDADYHIHDWVNVPINDFRGEKFAGRKPLRFCFWLFECLGLLAEDELHDLFPGSGAVSSAWDAWRRQGQLSSV